MGQEIGDIHFDKGSLAEFERRLREETSLLQTMLATGRFSDQGQVGGYELEAWLVDHNGLPAPKNADFLAQVKNALVVPELSRFNVELNGQPQQLRGGALSAMASELTETWQHCQEVAHGMDTALVMVGILPTVRQQDLSLANMSESRRYRVLNNQVLRRRGGEPLHIRIDGRERLDLCHPDVMLEAATTSFQLHLQCAQQDAVRYFNASLICAAPLLAVAGNSPYLFGTDLWDETRVPLFEQAVEPAGRLDAPRHRVSFGHGYVRTSLAECFDDNLHTYPVLLPMLSDDAPARFAHLRLHNGTIWRWVRPLVGFDATGTPHLRIEQRVLPAGPSVIDMFSNAALYYGLTRYLAQMPTPPEGELSFSQAQENFYAAARDGLNAQIHWLGGGSAKARQLLLEEILPMARHGLKSLAIAEQDIDLFLDILSARIRSGQTGATWQRQSMESLERRLAPEESLARLTATYLEQQRTSMPVHEWKID